ncbi:MAG: hypothetical protein AYK19_17500 [Theionarchaea archaeon DG-70-1]|nr:MAG: hypothetical protein AYK19_17500 [Theionarchaea archaeon DG-70-1]
MEGRPREIQEIYGLTQSTGWSAERNPYVHELLSWFAAFTKGVILTNIPPLEKGKKLEENVESNGRKRFDANLTRLFRWTENLLHV